METIEQIRKRLGYSQQELAKRTGLRQETISRIESGKNQPQAATKRKLANALGTSSEAIDQALQTAATQRAKHPFHSWKFLHGLDSDLRQGLVEQLISQWTHHSTSLEGNTISAGDTHLILTEGLTVSGKSLREHEEIHGHGSAIHLIATWLKERSPITVTKCHQLHRLVQTSAVHDIYAPIGKWKVEPNGTTAIRSDAPPVWHEYNRPAEVPDLMREWVHLFNQPASASLLEVYTSLHLSFVLIHPYADGNGRMARLLANIPLLKAGHPPLLIDRESRREYLTLLGDYCTAHPTPTSEGLLVLRDDSFEKLKSFFERQWQPSIDLVAEFHERQKARS